MTRNRSSAKRAGARFEQTVADYLAEHIDDRIERRTSNGAKDRGDIAGLRHMGGRLVVECKDTSRWEPSAWLAEADTERGNDDALAGLVIAKQRGTTDPGEQVVLMRTRELVALLLGYRPPEVEQ